MQLCTNLNLLSRKKGKKDERKREKIDIISYMIKKNFASLDDKIVAAGLVPA